MGYALTAVIAALAVSISVYSATGSILLAFFAYSVGGTMTLLLALTAAAFLPTPVDTKD